MGVSDAVCRGRLGSGEGYNRAYDRVKILFNEKKVFFSYIIFLPYGIGLRGYDLLDRIWEQRLIMTLGPRFTYSIIKTPIYFTQLFHSIVAGRRLVRFVCLAI